MLQKGAPYSYITLDLALLHENDKKTSCFSDLFLLVGMLKGEQFCNGAGIALFL